MNDTKTSRWCPRPGSLAMRLAAAVVLVASLAWLLGHYQAVKPMAPDYLNDRDFSFILYPSIKVYRVALPGGDLSPRRLDFFSVADGPTGEEFTEGCFPSWIVSVAALGGLVFGMFGLLVKAPEEEGEPAARG